MTPSALHTLARTMTPEGAIDFALRRLHIEALQNLSEAMRTPGTKEERKRELAWYAKGIEAAKKVAQEILRQPRAEKPLDVEDFDVRR